MLLVRWYKKELTAALFACMPLLHIMHWLFMAIQRFACWILVFAKITHNHNLLSVTMNKFLMLFQSPLSVESHVARFTSINSHIIVHRRNMIINCLLGLEWFAAQMTWEWSILFMDLTNMALQVPIITECCLTSAIWAFNVLLDLLIQVIFGASNVLDDISLNLEVLAQPTYLYS